MLGARLRVVGIVAVIAACALLVAAGGTALAAGVKVCVPSKEGKPIVTPKGGICKAGYTMTELGEGKEGPEGKEGKEGKTGKTGPEGKSPFTAEETATLKAILPFIKFISSGVGGKPTIQFTAANVQVVSGAGNQGILNGEGNLVIGYNETPGTQTGSNNLVLGSNQTFTSFGGLVAGFDNTISGQEAVAFGRLNIASGKHATVTGGQQNVASDEDASVSGGISNEATKNQASAAGGASNVASEAFAFIGGGAGNKASGVGAAILGGFLDKASGEDAAAVGGREDEATGRHAAVLGGSGVKVTTENGHTP